MTEQEQINREEQLAKLLWSPHDDNHLKQFDFEDGTVWMVYTTKENPATDMATDVVRLVATYPDTAEHGVDKWHTIWQDFPVTDPGDAATMLVLFDQEYARKWREERKEQSNQPNY
ncbi:hypothetical protein [Hymenobacter sp. YC55]|uniref:hypothetical protein n=1 Tax=Hymenobacter sp. YC55 TaxID=3034019 RepID=UPI0023F9A776|nr:hypothetical protein [Hymenobacter sp. YC55]MDF7814174.1 hypothetical protein [Hymenobacter sp. YC55]